MDKNMALEEFKKMWLWLSRHPAHDKKYYVDHVAKPDPSWKNDCPLCTIASDECTECLVLWDNGHGSLCTDPQSPLNKWKQTDVNEPHQRTWHAGELVNLEAKNN